MIVHQNIYNNDAIIFSIFATNSSYTHTDTHMNDGE